MRTATATIFKVETVGFEGPLELLIELVEKRKLLINNISLATVTDEYMARVSAMQEQSLPNTAQFITLAATLLLIKSKSLLPALDLTSEEEASIEDLGDRLRHYQIFRDASVTITAQFGKQILFEPQFAPPREPVFMPDTFCSISALTEALESVVTNLPKEVEKKPTATVKPVISLEDMMKNLQRRVEKQFKTSFFAINQEAPEQKTVIVGFLAILELFKQGNVLVTQVNRFADIEIELEQGRTPRYY